MEPPDPWASRLFEAEGCTECHTPPVYTDKRYARHRTPLLVTWRRHAQDMAEQLSGNLPELCRRCLLQPGSGFMSRNYAAAGTTGAPSNQLDLFRMDGLELFVLDEV